MLELVRKDRLPIVCEKIKSIYIKRYKTDKCEFAKEFVNKYKNKEMVYGNDFYQENPEYMYIDAMFYYLSRADIVGSITDGTDTLTVIDIKEYENHNN